MKTLLINPDSPRMYGMGGGSAFPLGLGYIAAVLEEFHDIEVIDIGAEKLDENSLISRISRVNPEIVGITSDTLTFQRSIEIAEMVKKIDEGIKVVIGGAHANALPTYPLNYECFDISIYGEGERTAVELWDKIENGQSHEEIKGIAWKQKDKIIINPRRELISNLDDLPFPARHLFPMDKYSGEFGFKISPTHAVSTSRGCPFSCSFCSNNVVFGRRYRSRSHENVVDEIELLISDFGAKGIYFREDIFTANKKRVANICNEIQRRGLEFEWICESRVNTINEEILRTM